jgi:hypothetical protein
MQKLHGLHEALIEQHNEKMAVIARLEILIRILSKEKPDKIVAKQPLKTFAGGTGYADVTAAQMAAAKEQELQEEYRVLAVIKEMIQEGGIVTP